MDGLADTGEWLAPADGERIIRLVAHHVGAEVHANSPRVSAEFPETGERLEGQLPPIVAAPAFANRKPAVAIFTLDDYVAAGIMLPEQATVLRHAIEKCRNVLVAGGTLISSKRAWSELLEGMLKICTKCKSEPELDAGSQQSAVPELEDPVEPVEDLIVMGYCEDRSVLVNGDFAEQVHYDSAALRVERRGRLIGKDDTGSVGQSTRNCHTLRFAAREFGRHCLFAVADLQILEEFDGAIANCRSIEAGQIENDGDVVSTVQKRQEVMELEDKADFLEPQPAQIGS